MPAWTVYLDRYGLTATQLHRLCARPVRVCVTLDSHEPTPAVVRLPPAKRIIHRAAQADRWFAAIQNKLPDTRFRLVHRAKILTELHATLRADQVRTLRHCRGVRSVSIRSIRGLRRKRESKSPQPEWYCVHGRVAVQIEGQTRGIQTVDDQYVMVKARDLNDAFRLAERYWRQSQMPYYFNSHGELVRWKLESVEDAVRAYANELDPNGVEVYSRLSDRRMRPENVWRRRGGRSK